MQEAPIAQGPVDVNVSRQCTCHPDDNPPQPCEHRYAFRDCADAAEERYLRETLAILRESYEKAAKPYIDRLVVLHSRSMPQMPVMVEQAQALGLLPANAVPGLPLGALILEKRMPLTNKEYVKRTTEELEWECPWCGSEELEWDEITVDGNFVTQEVRCCSCNKQWYDVYKLKGFVER